MRKLAVFGSLLAVAALVFVAARVANPVAPRAIAASGQRGPVEAPEAARELEAASPAPSSTALAPVEVADARQPVEDAPIRSSRRSRARELRSEPAKTHVAIAVVDASTNVPIERFGLRLTEVHCVGERVEGKLTAAPSVDEHPGGRCELVHAVDEDAFQVVAPGYSPREGLLSALSESGDARLIALSRGASIVGRAASSVGKVPSGHVRVRRASLGAGVGDLAIADDFDLSAFLGREQLATLGRHAEFELPDLAPGTYELEVRGIRGERAYVKPIRVRGGERVELAPIQVTQSATLRGQALVPAGVDPTDVRVIAHFERRTRTVRLDEQARFELDGLVAGHCDVSAATKRETLGESKLELELAPGEVRELFLDLRVAQPARPDDTDYIVR